MIGVDIGERVRETWKSLSKGDWEPLEALLASEARWRSVEDGPWNCESRREILETMRGNLDRGLAGEVEDVQHIGERAVVAFRPEHQDPGGWPLDNGIRYVVLSMRGELVTEMKGCANHATAIAYAQAR